MNLKTLIRTILTEVLPRALVLELQPLCWQPIAETILAEVSDKKLQELAAELHGWLLQPAGTEG